MDVGLRKGHWIFLSPGDAVSRVGCSARAVILYGSVTVTRTTPNRFLKPSSTV